MITWVLEDALENLRRMGCEEVKVQLPQGLTHRAQEYAEALSSKGFRPMILGMPAYGACVVEDPGEGSCLLHVGHLPFPWLVPERTVFYIPPRRMNVERLASRLAAMGKVVLATTADFVHDLPRLVQAVVGEGSEARVCEGRGRARWPGIVLGCNYTSLLGCGGREVVVTEGSFHALGLSLLLGRPVIRADPITGEVEEVDGSEVLRRRYAMVAAASDGRRWGVVISRLPGQARPELAEFLCRKILESGKGCTRILTDVVSPSLQDYGVDVLVNTACPRISIEDAPSFRVPILTPFEALQALDLSAGRRLKAKYVMDQMF